MNRSCIRIQLHGHDKVRAIQAVTSRSVAIVASLILALSACCIATMAAETPEAFVHRYFSTLAGATSFAQLMPLYTPTKDDAKMSEMLKNPIAGQFALMMAKSEPAKVKILSKNESPGVVTFRLAPVMIPPEFAAQSRKPGFSMTGEIVLHAAGDTWQVHKDFWRVKCNAGAGQETTSFGRDPDDSEKADSGSSPSQSLLPEPNDFEGKLRERLMREWQAVGEGSSIYVIFRLQPNGSVTDLSVKGEREQPSAEAQISKLFNSVALPQLPSDKINTPFAWMMFDWRDGSRSVSGPYFSDKQPDWLLTKMRAASKQPAHSSNTPSWMTP